MERKKDITPQDLEAVRESLRRAYKALRSWDVVGRRVLGKSGGYAWRVVNDPNYIPSDEAIYHWREHWQTLPVPWETTPRLMKAAWEIIKDRWGPNSAILVPELAKDLSVDPRRARATARGLRKEGYPVCSVRSRGGGYFRPRSLEEYRAWRNRTLWRPAADVIDTLGAMEIHEAEWFPPQIVQLELMKEIQDAGKVKGPPTLVPG